MKSKLMNRLEKLEAIAPKEPTRIRIGWITRLPDDFVGERHVVITERERTGSDNIEWCQFEERPGPAPESSADPEFHVHLTR